MRTTALVALLAALGLAALPACQSPPPPVEAPEPEVPQGVLALDFTTFDQTPNSGWRVLAGQGRFRDAARLIDEYIRAHPELEADQVRVLNFHAGQMYAFADDYTNAKVRFLNSLTDHEPVEAPIRWNAYVKGTIAFLDGSMAQLEAARREIVNGPTIDGVKPNLNFIDAFIENFGAPYSVAYSNARAPTAGRS